MPPRTDTVGGLIRFRQLDVANAPRLLTLGYRITDDSTDLWTQRFNSFKYGHEDAVAAGVRTMTAAFRGTANLQSVGFPARTLVVGAISSGDETLLRSSPVWQLGAALAQAKGWEWRPDILRKAPHRSLHKLGNAAERDEEVRGRYTSRTADGDRGIFLIVDDLCTRGATLADISRALRSSNPGWTTLGVALAKTERAAYWAAIGGLSNDHIHDDLNQAWLGRSW